MKEKWSFGKIVAVTFGSIGAAFILLIAFYIGVNQMLKKVMIFADSGDSQKKEYRQDTKSSKEKSTEDKEEFQEDIEDDYDREEEKNSDRYQKDAEYYEFHDEIRRDLSYQIEFETYRSKLGENRNVSIEMDYPVVKGDDLEGVNQALQKELEEVKSYGESVTEWLLDDETYSFETKCYVTYMDEEILSIIYLEEGYLDGEAYESYVISVNMDMDGKIVLTNSQLLDIDDKFSVNFRKRCEKQNGEIQYFSNFSDQDITYLLTDEDSLIIFYTPLGMEVGFNYYLGWVTVTYKDYEKYQNHL